MNITMIGTGNMGKGIGTLLVKGGHQITLISRDEERAAALANELSKVAAPSASVRIGSYEEGVEGDVVILAVWYPVNLSIAQQLVDQLAGKLVIDIANPLNETFDGLASQPGSSSAEELARALPNSRVVKAFNTTFAGTLVKGDVSGQALDVFIAGDAADAKAVVADLVHSGGLHPVDAGPLQRAQQLEGLGFLGISLQQPHDLGFMSAWKLIS